MFDVKINVPTDFGSSTLIIPCVCVGNVAQLVVDLLINSVNTEKIGYIYTSLLYPFVGTEALSEGKDKTKGNLSTACEIFRCKDTPVFIIQQRSPIVKGYNREFCSQLKTWIKDCKFEKVVILTGSFSHQRNDSDLAQSSLCRFLTYTQDDEYRRLLESQLGWKYMEISEDEIEWRPNLIPGGGNAYSLLKECNESGIVAVVCLIFCSEGNNIPEAANLASYVNEWIKLKPDSGNSSGNSNWILPASWKLLYGRETSSNIF